MNRASAPTHATHDELLIARLYGEDVDERERALTLDRMAGCEECAALFADMGAIASETAALPVPARPRDFTLTAADAARIGRPHRSWAAILGSRRLRAMGGSMAAIGFAGVTFFGALTAFMPATAEQPDSNAAVAEAGDKGGLAGMTAGAESQATSTERNFACAGSGSADVICPSGVAWQCSCAEGCLSVLTGRACCDGSAAITTVVPMVAYQTAPASAQTTAELDAQSAGAKGGGPGSSTSDLRLVGMAAFAGLALLGLILALVMPRLSTRAGR
jgi:hypothetical protein